MGEEKGEGKDREEVFKVPTCKCIELSSAHDVRLQ